MSNSPHAGRASSPAAAWHSDCKPRTSRREDTIKADQRARADRFELHLPLCYRPIGDKGWREGATENISRSGVLFQVADHLQPGTPVEMRFSLLAGPTAPVIACHGHVVRSVLGTWPNARAAVAVTIEDFTFVRGDD